MNDWKQILKDIYTPEIGSLWSAPNIIWSNNFATNKKDEGFHPALLERNSSCGTICYLVPGTSKHHSRNSCVFKIILNKNDPNCPKSYFLIALSMAYSKKDLMQLKQGWNGILCLDEEGIKDFKFQIKICKGLDV